MRKLQPIPLIALLLASLCAGCAGMLHPPDCDPLTIDQVARSGGKSGIVIMSTPTDFRGARACYVNPDDVAAANKHYEPVVPAQATAAAEAAARIRALPECPERYLGNAGTSASPDSEGGAVVLTTSPDSEGQTVVLVDPAGNHTSCHANSAHVARAQKYSVPPECPEHYLGTSLDIFPPDSEGQTAVLAKGFCHANPAHLAREQKYIENAIPNSLPKCPQGYHAGFARPLPDEKGEISEASGAIAELPNGKLCYANSAQVANELRLEKAEHAKWLEKCERSEFGRTITSTYNDNRRCWTSIDGCGQTVSETCAD